MEWTSINWIDIGFIAFILLFAFMGFWSGFTDKFFSSIAWVAASLLTLHLYPVLHPWVANRITNTTIASIVTFGSVFLVLIVAFKMGVSSFSKYVKDGPLGGLDRGLGILLGALSAIVILALLTIGMRFLLKNAEYPLDLQRSRVWVFSTAVGTYVERVLPVSVPSAPTFFNASQMARDLATDKTPLGQKPATYTKSDRQRIKKLI